MNRSLLVLLALLFAMPTPAEAQGITRPFVQPETTLWSGWRNGATTGTALIGGHGLPSDRGFIVTAITMNVSTVGGGGAGTTVVRITDGTNNCDATFLCTATASLGVKRSAATGTCSFPAGALLAGSFLSSTCTTTQPSINNADVVGKWTP